MAISCVLGRPDASTYSFSTPQRPNIPRALLTDHFEPPRNKQAEQKRLRDLSRPAASLADPFERPRGPVTAFVLVYRNEMTMGNSL